MSEGASRGGRLLTWARRGALFLVGFLVAAAGFRSLVPWPEEYGLGTKFQYFAEHKDQFDVLVLGSSRVYRSFDPLVFDQALTEEGLELRSFNLGVGGMRTYEQDFVLHRVLELEPERLKWILFEGGDWDPSFGYSFNAFSWRSVFWHSLAQTMKVLSAVPRHPGGLGERLDLARMHVQLWLSKLACYGQGREVIKRWRGELVDSRGRGLSVPELDAGRGFEAADEQAARRGATTHLAAWEHSDRYLAKVAELPAANRAEVDIDRIPLWALQAQYAAARARGIELVYLIPPGYDPTPVRPFLHERGEIPHLFDFNRPEEYPRLFAIDQRFDPKHLNRVGAAEFSRLLAADFAKLYRAKGSSSQ